MMEIFGYFRETARPFRKYGYKKRWIVTAVLVVSLLNLFKSFDIINNSPSLGPQTLMWELQGIEERDFPTADTDIQRIPHIIHQYYSTEYVPNIYVPYMRTFTQMNPAWEYRFWTYKSARILLEKHHPYLLERYDCFGNTVQNTNIARFLVLYHYGGIYADLDVEAIRPLDKVTLKYSCIFPPEPFEHALLGYKMDYVVQTATVMCRPFHPILKLILQNMKDVSCINRPQFNTGVAFITKQFMIYNNVSADDLRYKEHNDAGNSPVFYRGILTEDDLNAVFVPNTQYFSDYVAPKVIKNLAFICQTYYMRSFNEKRACNEFKRRQRIRERRTYSFMQHHWFNSYNMYKEGYYKSLKTVHIHDIIPESVLNVD